MQKIILALCFVAIFELVHSAHVVQYTPGRFRRDVDNLPAEEDAQVIVKIKESVTSLRHAETRLKAFIEKIEDGIKTGDLAKSVDAFKTKAAAGDIDFTQITGAFKDGDDTPKTFKDLVTRISDDTHILLDQLHGRLDNLGNYIKDVKHDAEDTSAEDHHKKEA